MSERPELKVFREIQSADEALSATQIEERTGMNFNTVQDVLQSLRELNSIEEIQTSGYTYYRDKQRVRA